MPVQLLYFDLGNVLVRFDPEQSCANVAALANCSVADARRAIYDLGHETRYERGDLSDDAFAAAVCAELRCDLPTDQLLDALGRMFTLHTPTLPLVAAAAQSGLRLGILSNTCAAHWEWIHRQGWGLFSGTFTVQALSYQLGYLKPEPEIYRAAADLAGLAPQELAFIDDRAENVAAARDAGWLAVQFHNPRQTAAELRSLGLSLPH